MKPPHFILATVFAAGLLGSTAVSAQADTRRMWDPNTKSFIEITVRNTRTYRPQVRQRNVTRALTAPRRTGLFRSLRRSEPVRRVAPVRPAKPKIAAKPAFDPKYRRQLVDYSTSQAPGTVIVDTSNKFLYYVLENGKAWRYGVGLGREGFGWTDTVSVGYKREWPTWTPPTEMIAREPHLAKYAEGMPGGPTNPLGARALYLYKGGNDTMYRIHGTNEPWSIGRNVSSGCIRMLNADVMDLYAKVDKGTKVIVM